MTMIYYKMNHAFVLKQPQIVNNLLQAMVMKQPQQQSITQRRSRDLFLIKTCIYKVTKLEDRSLITEIIYDGERHFYNRLKREKRITESINSKLNPEEIKTVDPSIIDSLK